MITFLNSPDGNYTLRNIISLDGVTLQDLHPLIGLLSEFNRIEIRNQDIDGIDKIFRIKSSKYRTKRIDYWPWIARKVQLKVY